MTVKRKKNKKKMNTKVVLLGFMTLALCSCAGKKEASLAGSHAEQIPAVKITEARKEAVEIDQKYSVTLQAKAVNNIAPQSNSRIISINAEVGDFVKKGQVLALMDKAQLEQAELQLNNLTKEYERSKALYKKGGVSQSDFESVELQYKVACTTFENLKTNTILESPLDGVVSTRNYDRGDMYSMSSPLFVVQQINPMKALVAVSEKDYSLLKKGAKVEFTTEALPGKIFTGSVIRIYPTIDVTTHTVTAEVDIPNAGFELRPGMYSNARLVFGVTNSVIVPDSAVQKQQGSGVRSVYVLKADGTVELRNVELGRHIGDEYVITNGVSEGEKVVVSGQSALKSGIKVQVVE